MIDDLDLLLHHGHPPGEVGVLPDLPGQLVQFCFRHGLGFAIIRPFAATAEEGAWKKSKLEKVKNYILAPL